MPYCSHCGEPVVGRRFCAACGAPVAPDAVAAMAAEMRRQRREMRLIAVTLGLVFVVSAGLVIRHSWHSGQGGEASTPVTSAPTVPGQAVTAVPSSSQPQHPPAGVSSGSGHYPGSQPFKRENTNLPPAQQLPSAPISQAQTPPGQAITESAPSSSPPQAPSPGGASSGSDRYPGSEPIKVDVSLPDIGIPVATEVYTTSDSVSAVISYYKQRYPDATVTDVEGQHVIAVSGPGEIKAITVGSTGSETRIAIVQPK